FRCGRTATQLGVLLESLQHPLLGIRESHRKVDHLPFGEARASIRARRQDLPQLHLQATDHHLTLLLVAGPDAPGETLWIEELEQCLERLRIAVVWCRSEEQAVLELRGQSTNRLRSQRVDRI